MSIVITQTYDYYFNDVFMMIHKNPRKHTRKHQLKNISRPADRIKKYMIFCLVGNKVILWNHNYHEPLYVSFVELYEL